MRHLNSIDQAVMLADNLLKTLFGGYSVTREVPKATSDESIQELTPEEKKNSAGLMRINHCGEVCAQALYQGQALTAKFPDVRDKMQQAAAEENDHLHWCSERLQALESRESFLNPLWYAGSFSLGAVAGMIGDKWSLGFVAETEHQVVSHLDHHLEILPENDLASRAIVKKMREDELKHATTALEAGGAELPQPIKKTMTLMSKIMTSTVYYI